MEDQKKVFDIFEEERDSVSDGSAELFDEESETVALVKQEPISPQSKHESAVSLVNEAKEIVQQTDTQMQECRLLLAEDLQKYEEAKTSLYLQSIEQSEALIEQIGEVPTEQESDESFVLFETKEEIAPMVVQDVSSGKFTALLFALIGGMGTFLGLFYVAANNLSIRLGFDAFPSYETMHTITSWFALPFTRHEDFNIGSTVIALGVIAVMALIYFVRVTLKGNANYRFALKQLEDAKQYKIRKGDCKSEMDKVDAHLNECVNTLHLYQVLLREQNGKLERILYLEKDKLLSHLHPNSKREVEETQRLLDMIYMLMQTPMSEEGKLSSGSALALRRTKEKADEIIAGFYK